MINQVNPLFFLCRHGATKGNAAGRYRGWSNEPDARLSGQGRDGVREAALWLQSAGLSFPLIISDDLDRAVETRDILKDILQIPVTQTDKRLRPLNVGDFTGKSKNDHPIQKYIDNPKVVIPGGESVAQFDKRMAKFFDDVAEITEKIGKPILLVCHGSTVSFLHNHFNDSKKVGYEGLCNPGGVLMFTSKGIEPLTQKREESPSLFKSGTALSGFVTAETNKPPRECSFCRWFQRDTLGLGACSNPLVMLDPVLVPRRQTDNTVAVGDRDCCDSFATRN